jgi:hypothetical protein
VKPAWTCAGIPDRSISPRVAGLSTALLFLCVFLLSTWLGGNAALPAFLGVVLASLCVGILWAKPQAALYLLLFFLPLHNLFLLLLAGTFHAPEPLIRVFQLWKEGIIAFLLFRILIESLLRNRFPFAWNLLDVSILLYMVSLGLLVFVPSPYPDLTLRLRGFSKDCFFFLAYFVGRALWISRRVLKTCLLIFIGMGSAVGAAAVVEKFLLPRDILLSLGYVDYNRFLHIDVTGLSSSYFVPFGARLMQRAGSFYIGSLTMAFALLAVLSIVISLVSAGRTRWNKVLFPAGLAVFAGLLLAFSRGALMGLILSIAVITVGTRRKALVFLLAFLVVAGIGSFIRRENLMGFVEKTVTLSDPSSRAHVQGFEKSAEIIKEHVFLGRGLGTAGAVAQRFLKVHGITNESWYLQIATEAGLPVMLLFCWVVLIFFFTLSDSLHRTRDRLLRAFVLGVLAGGVGLSAVGIVLHVWAENVVSYAYWLLAGIAVGAPALESRWVRQEQPKES